MDRPFYLSVKYACFSCSCVKVHLFILSLTDHPVTVPLCLALVLVAAISALGSFSLLVEALNSYGT